MNRNKFPNRQWPDKSEMAKAICEGADVCGYSGQRWGIMANALSVCYDVAKTLASKLATLGYDVLPRELRDNEACRLEGRDVIVVVERPIEAAKNGAWVSYDLTVYCRRKRMRPVISQALMPFVTEYGLKDFALLQAVLKASPTPETQES